MNLRKEYDCSKCNYRYLMLNFCGFCTKKLLDEIKEAKAYGKQNNLSAANKSNEQAV